MVETIASDPSETATTDSQAPLVVQQLRSAGVSSVIPLIPFNVFYPVLQAETDQQYFPRLLLSDYESSIESALGLLPIPYAEGTRRPGGSHHRDPRRHRRRPAARARAATTPGCGAAGRRGTRPTRRSPPATRPTTSRSRDRSVAGARPSTCSPPRRRAAGPDLNRRTFVTATVPDHRLPRHGHPGPQLRAGQAVRTDPVPDRQAAQQRPPLVDPVPAHLAGQSPGDLLGQRAARSPRCRPSDRPEGGPATGGRC